MKTFLRFLFSHFSTLQKQIFIGMLTVVTLNLFTLDNGDVAEANNNLLSFQTHHDVIPNFAANPTVTSKQSGSWSAPATWSAGRIPKTNDVVLIRAGHEVVYDTVNHESLAAVGIEGYLKFRADMNTLLKVGTLLVTPSGKLAIGTQANPIASAVTAEVILANRPLYTTTADPDTGIIDPQQFGTSLIVLGEIQIAGALKAPTWTRLAVEPRAGDKSLTLREPVSGWRPGDEIVLPDTRHLPVDHPKRADHFTSQTEVLTVSTVNGKQITLTGPLQFDHKGARDPEGTPTHSHTGEQLLPHTGNLTRNVVIRSEDPFGTRGHTIFTHKAKVDIRHAGFYDLGRTTNQELQSTKLDSSGNVVQIGTNQIGRYWTHFHHLQGPRRDTMPQDLTPDQIKSWLEANGWQYYFIGNTVAATEGSPHEFKWGIAIHGTHFGKVMDNVIYNTAGSGLQTEDGSESYNLFARNFAVQTPGEGRVRVPKVTNDPDETGDLGKDGSGFWYRGPHNWVENNVAADAKFSGHYYSGYYLKETRIPLFPGADPMLPAEGKTLRLRPLLSFANNEAYGPMQSALYGAWVSGCCNPSNWAEMKISGLIGWHPYYRAVDWYHNGKTTFDNLLLRGDSTVTSQPSFDKRDMTTEGMDLTGYENIELTIKNADIRGFVVGIDLPRNTLVTPPTYLVKSVLENYVNITAQRAHPEANTISLIENVKFNTFHRPSPSGTLAKFTKPFNIYMDYNTKDPAPADRTTVQVHNYNQVAGSSFQVYYLEGEAPCGTTTADIKGFICGSVPPLVKDAPPSAPTNLVLQ